jgi:hypothetical protein
VPDNPKAHKIVCLAKKTEILNNPAQANRYKEPP